MKTAKISIFFKKILSIINQTLMLLTVPVVLVGPIEILCFGLGLLMIYFVMASIYERKGDVYPFYRPNPMYGVERTVYRTVDKSKDILNSDGVKVGSIVSKEVEKDTESDNFQYTTNAPFWKFAVYILCYPIMRIVSLFASVVSLFTDKFYVQVSAPADFTPTKYNAFLFCYFDIVYERNETQITKYFERKSAREKRKAIRLERKKLRRKLIDKEDIGSILMAACLLPITFLYLIYLSIVSLANIDNPEKINDIKKDLRLSGISVGLGCIILLIVALIIFLIFWSPTL